MATDNRVNALNWWNHDLCKLERFELAMELFQRRPEHLTGREVQKIWETRS